MFAGVPFDIPDPRDHADVGVALRSEKVTATRGQDLTASVDLPLGFTTPAVYVLHGAGWIDQETQPAAVYELVYDDGSTHGIEVRPFNAGVADPAVGEWYHAFPIFDNPLTRHVSLRAHGQSPGATLYVMQIKNPRPDQVVQSIRFRALPEMRDQPDHPGRLGAHPVRGPRGHAALPCTDQICLTSTLCP